MKLITLAIKLFKNNICLIPSLFKRKEKCCNKELTKTKFPGVVVGKILEINNHPNADKLQLTKVDVGDNILDIVCGAKNIVAGQKVPVALIGCILPGDFEIKEAKIRGEKSFGMICAEDELGLGKGHEGIMVLSSGALIGCQIDSYV